MEIKRTSEVFPTDRWKVWTRTTTSARNGSVTRVPFITLYHVWLREQPDDSVCILPNLKDEWRGARQDRSTHRCTRTSSTEILSTLSYYGNESAEFAKKLKKTSKKRLPLIEINIAFKKTTKIKRIFLPIQKGQDSLKKEKKVVYKISCKDCDNLYIGETSREKSIRMKEHQKDIRKFSDKSHTAKHVIDHKHILLILQKWKH